MEIQINTKSDYTLIRLLGKRIDTASTPDFRKNVCGKMPSFHKTIILDLTSITFIDSSGLGALVAAFKQLPMEGKLLLCGAGQNVMYLLKLTQLDSVFSLFPDVATAVQRVQKDTSLSSTH